MLLSKRVLAGLLVAAIAVAACGGGSAASQLAKAPEYQPKDQTKCGVEKSQARPLIVEWPSADRQELEGKVRQGVVAVRYRGCEMDVLERCSVPIKYGYLGTTWAQDKLVIRDEDDLYANVPVGAARLEGKLQHSGQLTVDMNLVGRYEAQRASVRADELQGDCAGATHFIYGVSVGAFDFYAGADAGVGGGVGVGGLGAGASSQATRETLTKNGDPGACAKATSADLAPPEGCGALIRIEVVPLGPAKSSPGPAPPPSSPGVAEGATSVNGRLSPDAIQRVIRENFGRFRLCYETGLRSHADLQGKVVVKFAIDRSGAVATAADGGSDLPDPSVVSCVVRGIENLKFPAPDGGLVTVVYPIVFRPGD